MILEMVTGTDVRREVKVLMAHKHEAVISLEEPRRVLIVDEDDDSVGQMLGAMLQAADFDVVGICDSGGDAIFVAIEQQPDAVVLACGVPGWSVELMARWIREASPQVRIVAVSDEDDPFPDWADAHLKRHHLDSVTSALGDLLR